MTNTDNALESLENAMAVAQMLQEDERRAAERKARAIARRAKKHAKLTVAE